MYNNARQEQSRIHIALIDPHSVDYYCAETKTVYEFLGCFRHGCKCQPMPDHRTLDEDTLAERYEKTMSRIEQITAAGYSVKIKCECDFDATKLV